MIRESGDLVPGSFVYVVWVGSSLREQTKFTLVKEFCKDVGWFFKPWSDKVDSEIIQRSAAHRIDGNPIAKPYSFINLSIKDCFQHIIDDDWITLEDSQVMSESERRLRFQYDPRKLQASTNQKRVTSRQPITRQYLSYWEQQQPRNAVLGVAGVLLMIIIDAIVSNLFGLC